MHTNTLAHTNIHIYVVGIFCLHSAVIVVVVLVVLVGRHTLIRYFGVGDTDAVAVAASNAVGGALSSV